MGAKAKKNVMAVTPKVFDRIVANQGEQQQLLPALLSMVIEPKLSSEN